MTLLSRGTEIGIEMGMQNTQGGGGPQENVIVHETADEIRSDTMIRNREGTKGAFLLYTHGDKGPTLP